MFLPKTSALSIMWTNVSQIFSNKKVRNRTFEETMAGCFPDSIY